MQKLMGDISPSELMEIGFKLHSEIYIYSKILNSSIIYELFVSDSVDISF